MGLESLLKSVEWVDQQVLREYSKVAKRWEDKGGNIYYLSSAFGMPAKALITLGMCQFIGFTGIAFELAVYNWDFIYNLNGVTGKVREQKSNDGVIELDLFNGFYKKINRYVRLPTFLSGAGIVGKIAYDSLINGESLDKPGFFALMLGAGLLSIASSQYFKDRNPKLLDKQPFWKTAYNHTKNKLSSTALKPIASPQPTSYQTHKLLENYQ